ncbi:MAG: hypothetical protein Fur003_1770 [Candidatus Dojkabacteria bacterium]
MFQNVLKKYNGSASLITMIIIVAILLTMGITVVMTSIDLLKVNDGLTNRINAQVGAKTCFEESLNILKDNLDYVGNFSYSNPSSTDCNAVITDEGSGIRLIEITSSSGEYDYQETHRVDTFQYPIVILE